MELNPSLHKHFLGKPFATYNGFFYGKIRFNLSLKDIENNECIAVFPSTEFNLCSYFCFDVDGRGEKEETKGVVEKLIDYLLSINFRPTVVWSGNKGYHVYVFLQNELPSHTLRLFANEVLKHGKIKSENVEVEIYPKQDFINYSEGIVGNHLKLPGSRHPDKGTYSKLLTPVQENDSYQILEYENKTQKALSLYQISSLVKPYFTAGERHKNALGLAGHLKNGGVTEEVALSLIKRIAEETNSDKEDLERCIISTYEKSGPVVGLSLTSFPPAIKESLFKFIRTGLSSAVEQKIIEIRSEKIPNHVKVDKVITLLYASIGESYRIFHDDNYVYIVKNGVVITDSNESFNLFLAKYRLNMAENFGRQVRQGLLDYIRLYGDEVSPKKFSYCDGNRVLIYKSSTEAYLIEKGKDKPERITVNDTILKYTDFEYIETEYSIRSFFLSFGITEHECDLIITWIISYYLDIASKPILLIRGLPGSGKTTLAKFILQLLEGLNAMPIASSNLMSSLYTLVAEHKCLVIDNIEHIDSRTTDTINSLVTGTEIELRRLYTTNEPIKIKPKTHFIFTSAYNTFTHDGALSSRILDIVVPKRDRFLSETRIQEGVNKNYNKMKSSILDLVAKAVNNRSHYEDLETVSRLNDFITVGFSLNGTLKTNIEKVIQYQQRKRMLLNPIFVVMYDVYKNTPIITECRPFLPSDIYLKFSIKARSYDIKNTSLSNFTNRLLSTGLFYSTEDGKIAFTGMIPNNNQN